VTFGGTPGTIRAVTSDGPSLIVETPPHPGGSVEVRVTVWGETGSAADAFKYEMSPAQIMSVVNEILQ